MLVSAYHYVPWFDLVVPNLCLTAEREERERGCVYEIRSIVSDPVGSEENIFNLRSGIQTLKMLAPLSDNFRWQKKRRLIELDSDI